MRVSNILLLGTSKPTSQLRLTQPLSSINVNSTLIETEIIQSYPTAILLLSLFPFSFSFSFSIYSKSTNNHRQLNKINNKTIPQNLIQIKKYHAYVDSKASNKWKFYLNQKNWKLLPDLRERNWQSLWGPIKSKASSPSTIHNKRQSQRHREEEDNFIYVPKCARNRG